MSDSSFSQNSAQVKAKLKKAINITSQNHNHHLRTRNQKKQVFSFRFKEQKEEESGNESLSSEEDKKSEDSLLKPQIETLVSEELSEDGYKFLCKMKNISYLHLRWFTEEEICAMPYGKMKVTRYKKELQKRTALEEFFSEEETNQSKRHNFDSSYQEVDRIIFTTEIFQVVHPRQAQQIQGKWQEKCIMVMSKLMNYYKDFIAYATPFLEPVDPLLDGAPDYHKIIKYPMDFVQIHNRLHNGFYKQVQSF